MSPTAALVPEGTEFTLTVLGGFFPYEIAPAAGLTPRDGNTWVFTGKTVTGESELFRIEATDRLGDKATAEVTVYRVASALKLSVSEVTLLVGQSWTFIATGGSGGYSWEVDEAAAQLPPSPEAFTYVAVTPGPHTVTVTDSVGLSQVAAVIVEGIVPGAPLEISPASATVQVNNTLNFTAIGGTGPYTFGVAAGGAGGTFASANANPATYRAPGTTGEEEITLRDGAGATVSAPVIVIPVSTLSLSPRNPILKRVGDTIQFVASGGTGPGTYIFSSSRPNHGEIDAATGYYLQRKKRNVKVTVRDASGAKAHTIVKVN